jgi:hypothetical protein
MQQDGGNAVADIYLSQQHSMKFTELRNLIEQTKTGILVNNHHSQQLALGMVGSKWKFSKLNIFTFMVMCQ